MQLKIFILFFSILVVRPIVAQSKEEIDTLISWENKSRDSMAYVDAKSQDIYLYDNSFKIIDTIFKKYAKDFESAQVEILNFTREWATVNVQMRSICWAADPKKDSLLIMRKCYGKLKGVKIKSKFLLTYIQFPKLFETPNTNGNILLDLVSLTPEDETWPHIKDAQVIEIKPEWYKVEFKYKEKKYTGWIPAAYTCPMTFSWCG